MNRLTYFVHRNSSNILTIVGVVGVIGTSVLAVKATPKALEILKAKEEDKKDKLTLSETIKFCWKPYLPALLMGSSTILCIVGANILSTRSQASLASAYALLDNSYKEYMKKIEEKEKETGLDAKEEVINSKWNNDIVLKDGEELFFDYQSMQFFVSTMENVKNAEEQFLWRLFTRGAACLNEYYDLLGIERVDYGFQLGWFNSESDDPFNVDLKGFNYEEATLSNGTHYWIITPTMPVSADYIM